MDRLSAMALLVKVTELGSMSAAARALNMPLTTVSRHIGELESALGVRLLARTTRNDAHRRRGRLCCRRPADPEEVENAERRDGEYQEPKGELVISAPTMFGRQHVLPVISEFIARYPLIRVRLLLSDRNADGERPCRSGGADWRRGQQHGGHPPRHHADCGLRPSGAAGEIRRAAAAARSGGAADHPH